MRWFGRRRVDAVGAWSVGLVLGMVGFLPLFGGPGYEHALAAGIFVPSVAAVTAALASLSMGERRAMDKAVAGLYRGAAFASLGLGTAWLHTLRERPCDFWGGSMYYALTAGVGTLLAAVLGALAGHGARHARFPRCAATLLALAGPLGSIGLSLLRFYGSPMIFAFDPFVGYFSGTLYDTVVDAGPALLTYRAGTIIVLTGIFLALSAREGTGARAWAKRGAKGFGAFACFALAVVMAWRGDRLGHWQTSESIARELGGRLEGQACDIVFPLAEGGPRAKLLLQDCEEQVRAVGEVLHTKPAKRVTAFYFRDAAQKRALMGAENTYIAKPWRSEVYVQLMGYPHPVLGHEIAHVLAGTFGRGPFRIAGALGGWLPDPGLIEGIAVAASPEDDELGGMTWSAAMLDAGILPSMKSIFSLAFLGGASQKSYTAAGAFVSFVMKTRGVEAVQAWYGGAPVEQALGASLQELEGEFQTELRRRSLPAAARKYAKARFDRKGLFGRRCPHVVDAFRRKGDICREARANDEALAFYDEALQADPSDVPSRYGRAVALGQKGGDEAAQGLVRFAEDATVPETWRDRALEARADLDLARGHEEEAREAYLALARRSVDEDAARSNEVKAFASQTADGRRTVVTLLTGTPTMASDVAVGMYQLGHWAGVNQDAVARYLVGRQLAQRGFYREASSLLEALALSTLPTARIGREWLRQRAVVACVLQDEGVLEAVKVTVVAADGPFRDSAGGRSEALLRLLERCSPHPR